MSNKAQEEFWTDFSRVWIEHQDKLDASFAPILDEVLARADIQPGHHVLDLGCGTGTSTIKAATLAGDQGHVTGVDISHPMIDRARVLAGTKEHIDFKVADAAAMPFAPAVYDHVISRFGTMFFSDPVSAFENIIKGLKSGALLTMACWSNLDANPWFKVPMMAAKDVLGAPPKVDPDDPGPLAFRNIDRVTKILETAGFADVSGDAVTLMLTPPGTLEQVSYQSSLIGPAARTMEHFNGDESNLLAIAEIVAQSYQNFVQDGAVRVPAEINFFSARVPAT